MVGKRKSPDRHPIKYTKEEIKRLGEDLKDFAANAKSAHFATWCRVKGFSNAWLLSMCDHHPELAADYKEAKRQMAAKLVNSSIYKPSTYEFDSKSAMAYVGVHDEDYRDFLKFKADLQKQAKDTVQATFDELRQALKSGTLIDLIKQKD